MSAAEAKKTIIKAYPWGAARLYSVLRFVIMRERFTREIMQYLPDEGAVLDVGCGFGLFSLLFASQKPGLRIRGYDLNPRRIEMARRAAERVGIANAEFECGDAAQLKLDALFNGGFMVDLAHHLPKDRVEPFLRHVHERMAPGSIFVIKDVDVRPAYKRWFTWLVDVMMVGLEPIHYWPEEELTPLLETIGWKVHTHAMPDWLPYPHRIYICRKGAASPEGSEAK